MVGAIMVYADLSWASMCCANLTKALSADAILFHTAFTRANLTSTYLWGASMIHACFVRASLTGANLTAADLTDADLTDADLTSAVLDKTKLEGAKVTEAQLATTQIRVASQGSGHPSAGNEPDMPPEHSPQAPRRRRLPPDPPLVHE